MYYILYYANATTNSTGSDAFTSTDSIIDRIKYLKGQGYTHFSVENCTTGNKVIIPGYTN